IQSDEDWSLYPHRHAALTRTQLLIRKGETKEALTNLQFVLDLATRSGDPVIFNSALLAGAEVDFINRKRTILTSLREVSRTLTRMPTYMHGDYEAAVACAAFQEGNLHCGIRHESRSIRIHELVKNRVATLETRGKINRLRPIERSAPTPFADNKVSTAIEALATTFLHAARPRVAGSALLELIGTLRSVHSASVRERSGT